MRFDSSAAERFLSYADGETSLSAVWKHPAYKIARKHAEILGIDLSREDISEAIAGKQTSFSQVRNLEKDRERIIRLIEHANTNEADWIVEIERQLKRVTPDEDVSDLPLFLAVGYELGIGLRNGAYLNLNEPLFLRMPRQLLYVAIHESSHVLYDRVHNFSSELGPELLDSQEGQQTVFNTLFHTEAFATYTPLNLRKHEGNVGEHDFPICEDYRVLADETRLQHHVVEYDSFRDTLQKKAVSQKTLWTRSFGESRLPYRVGCAMLRGIEEKQGREEVREAFYTDPGEFIEEYDWVLDEYRDCS